MLNEKYSYNGYNAQIIINKKAELDELFRLRILNRKQYSAKITELKRGWKQKSLLDIPAEELNNTEIVGTSFAQEEPDTDVFPPDMVGVTFTKCNLGNCNIPPGNIVECFNKHYKVQNDQEYWVVDKKLNPIEPLSPKRYDKFGLSKDPKDIPTEKMEKSIIVQAEETKIKQDRKDRIKAIATDDAALDLLIEKGDDI